MEVCTIPTTSCVSDISWEKRFFERLRCHHMFHLCFWPISNFHLLQLLKYWLWHIISRCQAQNQGGWVLSDILLPSAPQFFTLWGPSITTCHSRSTPRNNGELCIHGKIRVQFGTGWFWKQQPCWEDHLIIDCLGVLLTATHAVAWVCNAPTFTKLPDRNLQCS